MKNAKIILSTSDADASFYPTPPEIAQELVSGIDWRKVHTVLEPSAGSGNLVYAVASAYHPYSYGRSENAICLDAVEIDPNLRAVLKSRFSEERIDELRKKIHALPYNLTEEQRSAKRWLEIERDKLTGISLHVVHDNFLTYGYEGGYDLIVMNPPFADGDAHLLKAIRMTERLGGQIRCILNAETLRNPYTARRKALADALAKHGAKIQYKQSAFCGADRATDVEIAMISLTIPRAEEESTLWSRLVAAEEQKAPASDEAEMIPTNLDWIERAIRYYNVEVKAGLAVIHEYECLKSHILDTFGELDENGQIKRDCYAKPMLTLKVKESDCDLPNTYIRSVRRKYWEALFKSQKIMGKFTSNLCESYLDLVRDLVNYEFSMFNIRTILAEMNAKMAKSVEDTILSLFADMTEKHSYYPEFSKNIHYYNGWKTNSAYKVGKRIILPCNGCFSDYSWQKDELNEYTVVAKVTDVEKVFDYLAGERQFDYGSRYTESVLRTACQAECSRNISCKYFTVTFYKKGTMHITFKDEYREILDRFNIFASQKKGWLPPAYGRVKYADLAAEEQSVVDSFHDGSDVIVKYDDVVAKSDYYLAPPTGNLLSLTA